MEKYMLAIRNEKLLGVMALQNRSKALEAKGLKSIAVQQGPVALIPKFDFGRNFAPKTTWTVRIAVQPVERSESFFPIKQAHWASSLDCTSLI
jgi:hypothetical protein